MSPSSWTILVAGNQRDNSSTCKQATGQRQYDYTPAPWLHEVIERAWRDEVVPDDWSLGILVLILKKGDTTKWENYRGISLIDVAAKNIAIVLLRRFQAVRDSRTRPNQAGFRAERGCADQIFTLRRILEFGHSYQQPTAVCFVDFAAAFDSVQRESLWRIMALDGVPAKIIAMIKAYYRSTTARVLVRNNLSQPFAIRSGVRQGCILSSILFNYAIDWILGRALRDSDGVEFAPGHRLTDLDYADDIVLLASSFGDLQSMVSQVNENAESVGLSINAGKTKVFSSCIPDQEKAPLGIDGCQLEEVDSFKYLGARLLPNRQSKDDIVSRIDAARWVFSSLRKCLWDRRDLSIATKIRVYRASVRSVLPYGCECWTLRVEDERKLEVFDHHCLRTILRELTMHLFHNSILTSVRVLRLQLPRTNGDEERDWCLLNNNNNLPIHTENYLIVVSRSILRRPQRVRRQPRAYHASISQFYPDLHKDESSVSYPTISTDEGTFHPYPNACLTPCIAVGDS
nr:unnamed protein product [Spirometra erinaceieuropaei]